MEYKQYLLQKDELNEGKVITTLKVLKHVIPILNDIIKFSKSSKDTEELQKMINISIPKIESILKTSNIDPLYKNMIVSGLKSIVGVKNLPIVKNLVRQYSN